MQRCRVVASGAPRPQHAEGIVCAPCHAAVKAKAGALAPAAHAAQLDVVIVVCCALVHPRAACSCMQAALRASGVHCWYWQRVCRAYVSVAIVETLEPGVQRLLRYIAHGKHRLHSQSVCKIRWPRCAEPDERVLRHAPLARSRCCIYCGRASASGLGTRWPCLPDDVWCERPLARCATCHPTSSMAAATFQCWMFVRR